MYIDSNKIKVFPSSMRGTDTNGNQYNPEARLTTEHNLTSMVNAGGKYGSFVISKDFSYTQGDTNTQSFVFCIDGYIFEIANAVATLGLSTMSITDKLYADIKVLEKDVTLNSRSYGLPTLIPYDTNSVILDRDGKFYGLSISKTRTETSLEILECVNDINHPFVRVPKASKFIAVGDDIDMSNVENDCKFKTISSSNIIPSDSSSTIGTSSNPFPHGYFKALNPETIQVSSSLEAPVITIRDNTGTLTTELNKNGASIKHATIGSLKATRIDAIANDNLIVNAQTINTSDLNVDADADITGICKARRIAFPIDQTEKVVLGSSHDKLNIGRVGSSETTRSWGFLYPESAGNYKLGYHTYKIGIRFQLYIWISKPNNSYASTYVNITLPIVTDKLLTPSMSSSDIQNIVTSIYGEVFPAGGYTYTQPILIGDQAQNFKITHLSLNTFDSKSKTCGVAVFYEDNLTSGVKAGTNVCQVISSTVFYSLLS